MSHYPPEVLGTDFKQGATGPQAKSITVPVDCTLLVVFAMSSTSGTLGATSLVHVGSAAPATGVRQDLFYLENPVSGTLTLSGSEWIAVFLKRAGVPEGYVGNAINTSPVSIASEIGALVLYGGWKVGSTAVVEDSGADLVRAEDFTTGTGFVVVCSQPGASTVDGDPAWTGGTNFILHGVSIPFLLVPITITPSDVSKVYGDADPDLSYGLTEGELLPGDVLVGTPARDVGEVVGDYTVTQGTVGVEDSLGNDVTDHYILTFADGMLTITPRPLSVLVTDRTKKPGDADPALTYTLEGTLAFSDAIIGTLERIAGEDLGEYLILQGTLDIASSPYAGDVANYSFVFVQGVLTIEGRSFGFSIATLTAFRIRIHRAGTVIPNDTTVAWVIGAEYLASPPAGIGSQTLRLLEGRVESQPYTVLVLDISGYITAHIFTGGSPSAYGRFAEVQRQDVTGVWTTVDLRRVTRVVTPSPDVYELELSTDLSPYETLLWTHSADIQLMPLGLVRSWHLLTAAGYTNPTGPNLAGKVLAVSGNYVQLATEPQEMARNMYEVLRDDVIETPVQSVDGNFRALRLDAGGADRRVVGFDILAATTVDEVLGVWPGTPLVMPLAMWVAWPGHTWAVDDNVGPMRLHWPDGVPTSEATPRLLGPQIDRGTLEVIGQHNLATVIRDVLDGTHGGAPISYDAAAVAALSVLGDEGQWYYVTAPMSRGEFLQREIWGPYLIGPFTQAGRLAPRAIWPGDAVPTDQLPTFGAGQAVSPLRYEYGGGSSRSIWRLQYVSAAVDEWDVTSPFRDVITAAVSRFRALAEREPVVQENVQQNSVFRREWADVYADLYSARVFALAGDGVQEYSVDGQITADAPEPGDLVLLLLDELRGPNPASAVRSGTRVVLVMERTRVYSGTELYYRYRMWDAGARAHSNAHVDVVHADTHSDSSGSHLDYHFDAHRDVHADVTHGDVYTDETGHLDSHGDVTGHTDDHTDGVVHGDSTGHLDSHSDTHNDVHQDAGHADAHGDTVHSDTHADDAHSDSHGDVTLYRANAFDPHCDVLEGPVADEIECFHEDSHLDHADHVDAHSDIGHADAHNDGAHADGHADTHTDTHDDGTGHNDSSTHTDDHTDTSAHTDDHSDAASGGSHTDTHVDFPHVDGAHADSPHTDFHQDGEHADGHADTEHTDWHDDTGHGDTHADSTHTDTHADFLHGDVHTDGSPAHTDLHTDDAHGDSHTDFAHGDAHGDTPGAPTHTDTHSDSHDDVTHEDTHNDTHNDVAHNDVAHQDIVHTDIHGDDSSHIDSHSDFAGLRANITDPHCDAHADNLTGDEVPCHEDVHGDSSHTDTHSDTAHSDTPHTDTHTDGHLDLHDDVAAQNTHNDTHDDVTAHVDSHSDSTHLDTHSDALHVDAHSDIAYADAHTDFLHTDEHTDLGHQDSHTDGTHRDAHRDQEYADAHADLTN